jgi:hypothetical protein
MMVDGREVRFQELEVTLPGAPFRCGPDVPSLPSGFTQLAACQSTVHQDYDGKGTPYDRLVVVVVALRSGRHVGFFSDFPHDGSKDALQAVVASVASLSMQR